MQDMTLNFRGRVLVVDQDDWCREFLSSVFKLAGIEEFTLVATVAEALKVLEESGFDLVMTDTRIQDHHRLLDDLHHRDPNIRFIFMAHRHAPTQQFHYHEQVDIVFKPLSLDEIIRKIRNALHQKHLRQMEEEIRRLKQEAFRMLL